MVSRIFTWFSTFSPWFLNMISFFFFWLIILTNSYLSSACILDCEQLNLLVYLFTHPFTVSHLLHVYFAPCSFPISIF